MSRSRRSAKVGATIRNVLGEALMGELKDPALTGAGLLSVTGVDVSGDLGVATVYVAGTFPDEDAAQAVLQGLERASARLRGLVAQRVRLRRVPDLRFRLDESIAHGRRIEQILGELKDDES